MNIIADEILKNKRCITPIIQTTVFWIEEFENYEQPMYIKTDVDFYTQKFFELSKKLKETLDGKEKIAFMEQEELKFFSVEESKKIIFKLLKKCDYYKQNVSSIISDKIQKLDRRRFPL